MNSQLGFVVGNGLKNSTPKVCILREVGSNGHREMIAAFYHAGFQVCENTVQMKKIGILILGNFEYEG